MASVTRKMNWRVRLWAYAPFLLWVGIIFFLSSESGSSNQTSRLIRPLLHFLFPGAPDATIDIYHWYVRKAAHFAEYAILALLVARAFLVLRPPIRFWPFASIGVVAVVACADEMYQTLDASRTASAYDSLLDICGGAFALLVLWLVIRRSRYPRPASPAERESV
jgi:VanZ family protein